MSTMNTTPKKKRFLYYQLIPFFLFPYTIVALGVIADGALGNLGVVVTFLLIAWVFVLALLGRRLFDLKWTQEHGCMTLEAAQQLRYRAKKRSFVIAYTISQSIACAVIWCALFFGFCMLIILQK